MRGVRPWTLPIFLLLVAGTSTASLVVVLGASDRIGDAANGLIRKAQQLHERISEMLTTTWTSATGSHTVTTTRNPDEVYSDFVDRHADEVAQAQTKFPKTG